VCREGEFNRFPPPAGQTCAQYAGAFADAVGGYIENGDATDMCNFCQYRYGQAFFAPLQLNFGDRWRDFGIFVSVSCRLRVGDANMVGGGGYALSADVQVAFVAFNILVLLVAARFL
jgi:hypothetical protein